MRRGIYIYILKMCHFRITASFLLTFMLAPHVKPQVLCIKDGRLRFPWNDAYVNAISNIDWLFEGTLIMNEDSSGVVTSNPSYGTRLSKYTGTNAGLQLLDVVPNVDNGTYSAQISFSPSGTDNQIDIMHFSNELSVLNEGTIKVGHLNYTIFDIDKINLPEKEFEFGINLEDICIPEPNITILAGDDVYSSNAYNSSVSIDPLSYSPNDNLKFIIYLGPSYKFESKDLQLGAATTTDSPDTTTTQPIPTTDDKDPSPGPTQPPVTSDSPTEAPTIEAPGPSLSWWAWLVLALGLLLLLVLIVVGCMCCEGCPGYKRRQRKQMKRGVYIDERVPPQPHGQQHGQPYGQPHGQTAGQPQGYPPGYPSGQPHGYNHSNGRGVSVHRDHRQDELSMQPRGQPSVVTVKTSDQRPAAATAYSNQGFTEPAPDYGDGTARITVSGRY